MFQMHTIIIFNDLPTFFSLLFLKRQIMAVWATFALNASMEVSYNFKLKLKLLKNYIVQKVWPSKL